MKKLITLAVFSVSLVACSGKQVKNNTESTDLKQVTTNTASTDLKQVTTNTESTANPGCACKANKCYYQASDHSFKWCYVVGGWKDSKCKKSPGKKSDPQGKKGIIKSTDNRQAWVNLDFSGLNKKSFNKSNCAKR